MRACARRRSFPFVAAGFLALAGAASGRAASLRFYGNGINDIDRVKVRVDDPATSLPGPPADVGATDFTIELWVKAGAAENTAPLVSCGFNINWIYGNIVVDRDRFNQDRKFGLSLAGGRVVFGVSGDGTGDRTICGTASVLDGQWHHVAVQRRRSDGWMWLFVDGMLQAQADGPDGDVSYPDDGVPGNHCGGPCTNSDPFLVLAAEKHDAGSQFPSYSGWLDEVRLSTVIRYSSGFAPPAQPFTTDGATAALYHFDEGAGAVAGDSSGAAGGPSNGEIRFGGSPPGPVWSADTPFGPVSVATSFYAAAPCRVVDTRDPAGPWGGPALAAGGVRTFAVGDRCGIPLSARAVSVNIAVTGPTAAGNLRLYPAGTASPPTAAINYAAGQTRANSAVVPLSAGGALDVRCSQAGGGVHFVLDVTGWFE